MAGAHVPAGYQVVVLAGRNWVICRRLIERRVDRPNLVPIGFTTVVRSLMAASDPVSTAPGAKLR